MINKMRKLSAAALGLLLLCSCAGPEPSSSSQSSADESGMPSSSVLPEESGDKTVSFTDALGREITLSAPERVAALGGSFAETWVLAGGSLAAATSDAWEERGLELDPSVQNLGGQQEPNAELLLLSEPDLVIANASVSGHTALEPQLTAAGITVAYFEVEVFEDYLSMLETCCELTGREDLYEQNGLAVSGQIEAQRARAQGKDAPTVLLLRAYSSGVKVKNSRNNMTGAMLADLGCVNIADGDETLLEELSLEKILSADPDYIFVTTMGSSTEKAMQSMEELLTGNPAWASLSAVSGGQYHVLPKDLFHYKPNARWGEAYEMLADILYPAQ